ncbi:flagellar hook-associated protein 2 [Lentibacillus persicus]|uniref:Flagellar hook-associated protein 2 n=1 Tax=Lentibacillus persicus TaxID=640948 RepID=A0A1I1WPC3_9BACI|nr:flagellar hook-associated protein 2 [Lentibacillus persicus]SFD96831.1 flagellar hook-associated protein 2 [Lentibacillus persicus]
MRIGGLASGMDIDSLVNRLMNAERMPLQKMEQDQTTLTWKRDAFRDVNKSLAELDDMILNMKMGSTYNSKSISSSQEDAVTATGSSSANNGTYNIEVTQLATSAVNISEVGIGFDADKTFAELKAEGGLELTDEQKTFEFMTYKENGDEVKHSYVIEDDESLNDLLKRITDDDNHHVRAIYDSNSEKVIMETTRTGNYNTDENRYLGAEIAFDSTTDSAFLRDVLNLKNGKEVSGEWEPVESGGTDSAFKYNGIDMTSRSNSYELGGVTFQFNDTTTGNGANLTVTNNVEQSHESIMNFVDKYNEVVDKLNGTQQEEKFRDYPPLTDEQKEEMSEREIELWEEKAKSGILRGESAISQGLFSMRSSWYSNVQSDGAFSSLTQVGISTTRNYLDGGKLEVNEQELKDALASDPDSVFKLFSNDSEDEARGVINRLEDALDSTIGQIEQRAGKGTDTLDNYTLGKRMKDLTERIGAFEDRMVQVENRYWSQFSQMEQAIQKMNQQSTMLTNQFSGGGMM